MTLIRNTKLVRTILVLAVAVVAAMSIGVAKAQALTPEQTTEKGVVNLTWNSINSYWAQKLPTYGINNYFDPGGYYYDPGSWTTHGCGSTDDASNVNNSFYCPPDHNIYLDYNWNQSQINSYGDGAAAFILAHEWGHHIQSVDGWWGHYGSDNARLELNADCLAGMYFRSGIANGILNSGDYTEAYNWAYYHAGVDGSHGTPQLRAAWFKYGYQTNSLTSCNGVFYN